ncbi:TetR/AcrR family transcriptional regulator [Kocuria rosea]|uniref:TetR/AcrR family transcriptional regulator n=1 Tax=Kocuria rosea TaxID=1275 RepID=UPI00203C30DC|nr:TetR/AcrR family transcriptional regulator [Kocuria rosea]
MARPKDQTKRRDQLVAATAAAVLQRGSTEMRLTDIAQEAGLSPASVLYYYPDVQELFMAVFAQGSVQYCEQREARVAGESEPLARLHACIRSGIPWPGPAEEASRILYELMPIVLRNEIAATRYHELILRQVALYRQVLEECEASGRFRLLMPPESLARSFVALEDGYGVEVITGATTPEEEEGWLLQFAHTMVLAAPAF